MKRTVSILLALMIPWIGILGPAETQSGGLTMSVTVGWDGYCRHGEGGNWCPVYAVLSNDGAGLEGELRVRGAAGADPAPALYARRVELPTNSRKAVFLYIPAAEFSLRSRLEVQLVSGGEVLTSERATVTWMSEGDRLYGVASSDPSALNFLSEVAPPDGQAAVAHVSLESLPPDPLGWEGLDVLVLNDLDTSTSALSGDRRQALETWVAHGGHLVVGGGAGTARTVAGVADLLPVTVGGTRTVQDLVVLGQGVGAPVAPGPYAVAAAVLRDGEVLARQVGASEDLVLLARRAHASGTVDFLAFDAGLNPFTRWDDNALLWEWIVGARAGAARRLTVQSGPAAHGAVETIPGLNLPSAWMILAFTFVYTLLVGPVNYAVLRRLDRRDLAWLSIPALILVFTAFAYVTGLQIRGRGAILHRLAAVYVPQGAGVGRVTEVVGLFSPRRTEYDVWVGGSGVRHVPDVLHTGPVARPLSVIHERHGVRLADLRVDAGGIRPFIAEGYAHVPPVEANLRMVSVRSGQDSLEGSVQNGAIPLQGAVLLVGAEEERLGDLDAGEVATVHVSLSPGQGERDFADRILGAVDYRKDRDLYRRHQFLQALASRDGATLGHGAYLVGWGAEAPLPAEVIARPYAMHDIALYVYALPVEGLDMVPSGVQ